MLRIRLRRVGGKKQPSYRLVVTDIHAPRDGAFISVIGHYNPLTNPETVVVDEEKALQWLKKGAQPTDTAARLLAKLGIIERPQKVWAEQKTKPEENRKPEEKIKPEEKPKPEEKIKPEEKT